MKEIETCNTRFILACKDSQIDVVMKLINDGAYVNTRDIDLKAFDDVHFEIDQIDKIPRIQSLIQIFLWEKIIINNSKNPDEVITSGTEIFASSLIGEKSKKKKKNYKITLIPAQGSKREKKKMKKDILNVSSTETKADNSNKMTITNDKEILFKRIN
ncbi:hypothetical protein U3516DRAFT_745713 [Neocallimastix sp. 'constans']